MERLLDSDMNKIKCEYCGVFVSELMFHQTTSAYCLKQQYFGGDSSRIPTDTCLFCFTSISPADHDTMMAHLHVCEDVRLETEKQDLSRVFVRENRIEEIKANIDSTDSKDMDVTDEDIEQEMKRFSARYTHTYEEGDSEYRFPPSITSSTLAIPHSVSSLLPASIATTVPPHNLIGVPPPHSSSNPPSGPVLYKPPPSLARIQPLKGDDIDDERYY